MNRFSSQIENHDFVRESSNDVQPILEKVHRDKDYSLSEGERYSASVFKWAGRILECFVTLEHARAYIGHFRTNKWYAEAGIGRSHYINYHYFNYAITTVRIMDVALILTNTIFRLGNPERLCRLDNINENYWVRSAGIDELLKKLNATVEPWREPRNLFVHRGATLDISGQRQDSKLLFLLEAYDRFSELDTSIASVPFHLVKSWYRSVVSGIFKEFDQTEKPLLDATSGLLSGLLPIYKSWHKALTQTSNAS